jgi:hypothetical protein
MKIHAFFTLSLCVMTWACDSEPARIGQNSKRGAADSDSGLSLAAEIKTAESQKEELITQKSALDEDLNTLRLGNNRMCERLFTYRTQCPVAARLRSTDNERVLGCVGNFEDGARLVPRYFVKLSATSASGSFFLRADNAHDSTPFGLDKLTEIKWNPINASDTQTPRIWDLSQLKLKAVTTGNISQNQITDFEFRVNDKIILNKSDLVATTDSSATIDISLANLLAWKTDSIKNASPCMISDEEIDDIISGAKADAQAGAAFNLEEKKEAPAKEEDVRKLENLKSEISAIKKQLGDVLVSIDRESDRSGKLTSELRGERNVGCFAKLPISMLELEISGAHLPNKSEVISKEKATDTGNPRQFIFRFGNQFAHTNSDEEQQALLVPGGHLASRNFSAKRIGDIEYISLEKGGVGFDATTYCYGTIFKSCRWKNSEKNIYRLDSIALKVNGEEIYRKDDVNFTFQEGALTWSDKNLGLNQAYRALMRRTDCPAQ